MFNKNLTQDCVTIIVPCYNGKKFIEQCFGAILNQTYKNIETIFVDDGSNDDSFVIAKEWEEKFLNRGMKLICLKKENGGAASAINNAFSYLSSEYFEVLDVDDYIYPQNIEIKMQFLKEHPEVMFVRNNGEIFNVEKGQVVSTFCVRDDEKSTYNIFRDSIVDMIESSNLRLRSVEIRPVCYDDDTSLKSTVSIIHSDIIGERSRFVNTDLVANLLIFTAFDGFVENKYSLPEGESFKRHYEILPESTDMEKIQKNCYRILKLMRNAMQHNLSGVTIGPQEYVFSYSNRNTVFQLEISRAAVEYLYSIILNLIKGQVYGLITLGHYEETLKEFYKRMLSGIVVLEDEFGTGVSNQISGMLQGFRVGVRYPLENPRFYKETEDEVIFLFYETGSQKYAVDYMYYLRDNCYVLPEELGRIFDEESVKFIGFQKSLLIERWKKVDDF